MSNTEGVKYRRHANFLLATLGRRVEHAWHSYLTSQNVTTAQFTIMVVLVDTELTQRELADAVEVDPRNVSATVKVLLDKGWIESRPSPTDRRARFLSATPRGLQWWETIQEQLSEQRKEFFAALDEEELRNLEGLLLRLEGREN
ncbi:MAG: MarR family transcriptional regulator [Corynebacterium sp.]|nr:MarR family transcriptional regulator [Corynebacterium sp.]